MWQDRPITLKLNLKAVGAIMRAHILMRMASMHLYSCWMKMFSLQTHPVTSVLKFIMKWRNSGVGSLTIINGILYLFSTTRIKKNNVWFHGHTFVDLFRWIL